MGKQQKKEKIKDFDEIDTKFTIRMSQQLTEILQTISRNNCEIIII